MFVRGGGGGSGQQATKTRRDATSETAARFVSTFAVAARITRMQKDNKVLPPPLDLLAQRTLGIGNLENAI